MTSPSEQDRKDEASTEEVIKDESSRVFLVLLVNEIKATKYQQKIAETSSLKQNRYCKVNGNNEFARSQPKVDTVISKFHHSSCHVPNSIESQYRAYK